MTFLMRTYIMMRDRGAVIPKLPPHRYPGPPSKEFALSIYVEKTVAGKPLSLVGPFDSPEKAARFIREAWREEEIWAPRILARLGTDYREVCYSIIDR